MSIFSISASKSVLFYWKTMRSTFQCRIKVVLSIQTQRKDQKDLKHPVNIQFLPDVTDFILLFRPEASGLGKSEPSQFVSSKMQHI